VLVPRWLHLYHQVQRIQLVPGPMNSLWFLLLFTVRSPIVSWMIVADCCWQSILPVVGFHTTATTIIRTLQFPLHSIDCSLSIADDYSLYMSRVGSSLSKTESCLPLSMTEFLFPLSMTEFYPPLSMTELYPLYPPLSILTEFYSHAILIQNILPAHGTLVCSNSYDKITSAVTNDLAVFLIDNALFYMQIYLEWSVRMVYNFLDLTQNGLCFCTNRYLIYRRILNIWLSFQRHIMYRHDFISLVQHKLRLPTLTLRQIKVLSMDSCEDTGASYASMGGGRITNTEIGRAHV